jgi:hypothetical protein
LRKYIGAAQVCPLLVLQLIFLSFYAAFCLFVRTLPIDFALLGRKRKYIKSKTTTKFKRKTKLDRRDQFLSFATFPTPLPSRYRLPLNITWLDVQQVGQYLGGLHFNVPPYGTDISQPTENVYFEIQKLVKVKGALQVT